MKREQLFKRILSLVLAFSMLVAYAVPANASSTGKVSFEKVDNSEVSASLPIHKVEENEAEEPGYADTDMVRVSIVLDKESTIAAGFSVKDIAENSTAMSYRSELKKAQDKMTATIEKVTGEDLDVVWNLTLAANIISANVAYGQIAAIEKIPGVAEVLIETRYEPDVTETNETVGPEMATSSAQIGSAAAWAAGYTGAGSRIAVIDTGIDSDHQSFNAEAFQYSLAYQAGLAGMSVEDYLAKLDLLDAAEVSEYVEKGLLNVDIDPELTYVNSKIPFAYNYVDEDYDITHDNDTQEEHGSHVEGIAAANAFILNADGTFSHALDTVKVQGVAPDAQIITMKVFGKGGGAYDSDYMVAIEDAIVLGADSINLSLGSGNPGMSRNSNATYQAIMESLTEAGAVVCMSAGNSGSWVENAMNAGYLYSDDVSMQTNGSPGSFTNSLAVASVDNDGSTGAYVAVGDSIIIYTESAYSNAPMATIAGTQEYVFIDGYGTAEDWAAVGDALEGKIAICSRGTISFYQKAEYAVAAGAIATIIYNNDTGVINMDLSDYKQTQPCVSITQAAGAEIKAASTPVTTDDGAVLYYTGTMTVSDGIDSMVYNSDYYTMSSFSSWGIPGSLELKPEITAPGGSIYSVWGSNKVNNPDATDKYEGMSGTSMASPQVAGMAAVVAQYIRDNDLEVKTGLTTRQLVQSLLMSTAVPMREKESDGQYYSILRQGSGLANVGNAVTADSYILMGEDATASCADGKVKAELGDDPERAGEYSFSFTINNLTDEDRLYNLYADFFTQDIFLYYANGNMSMDELAYYMDTLTAALEADTTFTVDGVELGTPADMSGLDVNGDKVVNSLDGQAILDYAAGTVTELANPDVADIDGDGDVDSYDAYLFFSNMKKVAKVPANGSVEVTVTVKLTDDQKAYLDASYESGAYIEGFVYAEGVSSEEGVTGTTHSIPVIGFYGNWSDASMYEVGSYAEYAAGDEDRIPYLGKADANSYLITYADDPKSTYSFGGNPLVPDDTYMPERNAINSENGDAINKLQFTAIRNAAASRFTAVNVTTGETYIEAFPGAVSSAYYYTNGSAWKNTSYTLNTKFVPANAAEGDILSLALTLAPEYYVDAEGNADWDALGTGADFGVTMVVDNTAPELKDVSVSLTGNTMTVTASDNQYVAAVALYNKAGTSVYTYTGAKQDIQPGEEAEYVMDLDGVNGKKFLLQVFDYAMNAATYVIEMQIGEEQPLPGMMVFDLDDNYWTTFTKETKYTEITAYSNTNLTFVSGTIVDHMVLAGTNDGDLYVMPEDDLTEETLVGKMGEIVTDMAYNKADGKVYGVASGYLVTIDKLTGELEVVDEIGITTNTLACDANGTFYCNKYGSGEVYSFTLDTIAEPELLVATNLRTSQYIQTMEIDPNTGILCWNSYYATSFLGMTFGYSYYYEIDTATGAYTRYNDLWDEMAALIIPVKTSGGSGWLDPTDKVSGIQISDTELTLLKGSSETLTATVQPWTAVDRTVTWTTSDPAIATVDDKGVVTAVSAGECVITATSNLDPTVSAECKVTVELLTITLRGALQDKEGVLQTFEWNMETDDTWTGTQTFSGNIISGTSNGKGIAYATDGSGKSVITMDLTTGETATVGAAPVPLADMAISEFSTEEQDLLDAVYYYYFLPAKDPTNITTSAFGFSDYLSQYTGGSEFVGVTTDGWTNYNGNDAEVVYLVDNAGYIWQLKVYATDEGYSCGISFIPTNLVDVGYEMTYDENDNPLSSLVVGADGNLYFSAHNGETNVIYRLVFDSVSESFTAIVIGNVGENVWPAVLFEVTSNGTADGAAINALEVDSTVTVNSQEFTAEEMRAAAANRNGAGMSMTAGKFVDNSQKDSASAPAETTKATVATGSLNATVSSGNTTERPMSITEVDQDETTVTVDVTAKDATGADVDATNGVATVTYDPEALTLTGVVVNGDYTTVNESTGSVTFGFVDLDGIAAGSTVAKLVFEVKSTDVETITVTHKEVNNTASGYVEEVAIAYGHTDTEVRGAKAATCTEDGYTGDTYCVICGKMIAQGEIIPATGHDWSDWTVTEATCTEDGSKTRSCATCGETETEVIPATGHSFTTTTVEATCTEEGYDEHVCDDCGYSYRDNYVEATGHDWSDWTVAEEATCFKDGSMTRTCATCGEVETVAIPAGTNDCPSARFTDVNPNSCAHEGIDFMVENGYMNGTSETTFAPYEELTRAQLVTILHRIAGEPVADSFAGYTDTNPKAFYAEAVDWAAANGIVTGYPDGTFHPYDAVTRQDMVTILYRFAKYQGKDISGTADLSVFDDQDMISGYAVDAMSWAVSVGLINGINPTTLAPKQSATRAHIAIVAYRYCTEID